MPNIEHLPDPSEASASTSGSTSAAGDAPSEQKPVQNTPADPVAAPQSAEETQPAPAQSAALEPKIIARPIPLVAPKPTRPGAVASIFTQSFTPPRTPVPPSLPASQPTTQPTTREGTPQPALAAALRQTTPRRPPVLLDTAICVLLVLLFALVCRRVL